MKEEDLIKKWLDNNLNDAELEAFKQLDAYSSYLKISENAKRFEAPQYDVTAQYASLTDKRGPIIKTEPKRISPWLYRVAAVLVISVGLYFAFFNNTPTAYYAENAGRQEVVLPDASTVVLNADSQLSFDKKNWSDNRNLTLDGEAYFKVAKGQKFTVRTNQGSVAVLGTQFNVKNRAGYFEVSCYEGLVEVEYRKNKIQLSAGNVFRAQGAISVKEESSYLQPSWMQRKSTFKSVPVSEVLDEIERQYDVTINTTAIKKNTIFTGSFTHDSLETALQSVTIPFGLNYTIQDQLVTLTSNN